jgi:hypothetical protein
MKHEQLIRELHFGLSLNYPPLHFHDLLGPY